MLFVSIIYCTEYSRNILHNRFVVTKVLVKNCCNITNLCHRELIMKNAKTKIIFRQTASMTSSNINNESAPEQKWYQWKGWLFTLPMFYNAKIRSFLCSRAGRCLIIDRISFERECKISDETQRVNLLP